MKRHGH